MKRIFSSFLITVLIICIAGCKSASDTVSTPYTSAGLSSIISQQEDKESGVESEPTQADTPKENENTKTSSSTDSTCRHVYLAPTCTDPEKCAKCGVARGKANGHTYRKADCTRPTTCTVCSLTFDKALGHSYSNGACTRCKASLGSEQENSPTYIENTALYLGDSISFGDKDALRGTAWCGRISKTHSIKGKNVSVCGWYLADVGKPIIVSQFDEINASSYEYIILQGGVNDIWSGRPMLGEVSPENTTRFDVTTVAGALENIFATARRVAPNSKIGFIINFHSPLINEDKWDDFVKLAKAVCDKWSIPYIDLDAISGFSTEFKPSNHLADNIHPNSSGYDILAKYIGDWMLTL